MHLSWLLVVWSCLVGRSLGIDVSAFLSQIPDCAGSCLLELASNSTCGIDIECLCADSDLQTVAASCVMSKCMPREALFALNITASACEFPVRDIHKKFDILNVVMSAITVIVVCARIFQKLRFERSLRLDDYLIVVCLATSIGNTISCVFGLSGNGFGRDAYMVGGYGITEFLKYIYIGQTFYATDVFLTKICVLLFYLRIFPVRSVQRLIWGTIAFNALSMVAFVILAIAQCQPISYFWTGWDKEHEGHCVGTNPLAWALAAVSIAMDFWVLAIPVFQLLQLQMKWQRKLAVALMFVVGTFVSVVSIIRLQFLIAFGKSNNPTWDFFNTCYWSVIEINVAIWCACMPDLRLLIVKSFPRLDSSNNRSHPSHGHSSVSSRLHGKSPNITSNQTEHSAYNGGARVTGDASSSTAELVEMTRFMNENSKNAV
ncbi:uncharacterized protein FIESC28_07732 [Fusarium coffeatum]|uniref:CFEM domain-containing protein n=1 Tax=Fusarium coffeatum TaxID=231269 RepID=A0A366RDT1_9HYPO|nr:uncharacterized protein FIESC28_07732 [Fusarium coffeatum]RBR14496.1 hypothetical protein FIESC28_07732 [Fusarium coffeatum]